MRIWSLILLIFVSGSAAEAQSKSAGPTELEAVCREVLCREPRTVRLKLEGGKEFEGGPKYPTPIVTGALITVLPGETVMVEASLEGGKLASLKAVAKIEHPERTLVFSLRQEPTIGDGLGMILTVDSPFPGVLKYRLGMMGPSDDRLRKTSVCPLSQGVTAYEHWPYPLFQVAAMDFQQVDPSSEDARKCQ